MMGLEKKLSLMVIFGVSMFSFLGGIIYLKVKIDGTDTKWQVRKESI